MTRLRTRIVVDRYGDARVMRTVRDAMPVPRAGEVRVRVHAAGVAYGDVLMRSGRYPGGPRPPFVPGWDVAGVVEELGPGVPAKWRGARVVALVFGGGYASDLCVRAIDLIALPDDVSIYEAACLPLNYVAAYQMLHRVAAVRPGERILVHGAAGGVGTALLDLARCARVEVFGTASENKRDVVTSFGASVIDYRAEDFVRHVLGSTGEGVDVVLDAIGGDNLTRSFKVLRRGGRLVSYGFSALAPARHPAIQVLKQILRLRWWSMLPNGNRATFYRLSAVAQRHPRRVRNDLAMLVDELRARHLHPLVARRLPLENAWQAHTLLERTRTAGKLLLVP